VLGWQEKAFVSIQQPLGVNETSLTLMQDLLALLRWCSNLQRSSEMCVGVGPGKDMFDSCRIIGKKQFDKVGNWCFPLPLPSRLHVSFLPLVCASRLCLPSSLWVLSDWHSRFCGRCLSRGDPSRGKTISIFVVLFGFSLPPWDETPCCCPTADQFAHRVTNFLTKLVCSPS
jgi:hypothetical protein